MGILYCKAWHEKTGYPLHVIKKHPPKSSFFSAGVSFLMAGPPNQTVPPLPFYYAGASATTMKLARPKAEPVKMTSACTLPASTEGTMFS